MTGTGLTMTGAQGAGRRWAATLGGLVVALWLAPASHASVESLDDWTTGLTHSVSAGNDRHFPYLDSLAEALVKAEGKGAIATFSPSGMSVNGPASVYHEALLAELVSGRHRRLGDALLAAQVTYAHTGAIPELLSLYHLFGDPALVIQ